MHVYMERATKGDGIGPNLKSIARIRFGGTNIIHIEFRAKKRRDEMIVSISRNIRLRRDIFGKHVM